MMEINEPVDVWVLFQKNNPLRPRLASTQARSSLREASEARIQPAVFFWHGRRIKIEKINLVHTSKNGANIFYHFSISSGGNFYRLKFDISNLNWSLEAVEEEL